MMDDQPPVMPDAEFYEALVKGLHDKPVLQLEAKRRLDQARRPAVEFNWTEAKTFVINGQQVAARGKGLALAWLLLASFRYRLGHLQVDAVFPGPYGPSAALQCLKRTAALVEQASPALARCIRSIGLERGVFALRAPLHAHLELDAPLLRVRIHGA